MLMRILSTLRNSRKQENAERHEKIFRFSFGSHLNIAAVIAARTATRKIKVTTKTKPQTPQSEEKGDDKKDEKKTDVLEGFKPAGVNQDDRACMMGGKPNCGAVMSVCGPEMGI
jgi:hypothetical protein